MKIFSAKQKYMKLTFRNLHAFIVASVAVAMMASCSSQKSSLTYFEDLTGIESGTLNTQPKEMRIMPEDELQIVVTSLEPTATAHYNSPVVNPSQPETKTLAANPQQLNYIVDEKGNIVMPVLGKVHVAGLTVGELTEKLTEMISRDVTDPFVSVRLKNVKVQVLGEVHTAGNVTKADGRESLTVLEAIAAAGDMTEYSDRSNVMVLRREPNGELTYHRLNLNEASSLKSPYFYLEQNDVVIVPPTKVRQDNAKYNTNNSFKMQVVSTVVSVVSVIASLVIALVVK